MPGSVGGLPQAINRREQLAHVAPPFGKFASAGVGLRRLCRAEPVGGEMRKAADQLQLELPRVASGPFGQCPQYRETAVEMADCFEMRHALRRVLTGL